MNPYERGLDLPGGCKDLFEALKLRRPERPRVVLFYGGVVDMERHISGLLREPAAVRWLAVLWTGQSDFVYLVFVAGSLNLLIECLRRDPGHEQAIRGILLEAGIPVASESIGGNGSYARLRYLLPLNVEDAAELIHEVLLRGCVVSERTELLFRVYEDTNDPRSCCPGP